MSDNTTIEITVKVGDEIRRKTAIVKNSDIEHGFDRVLDILHNKLDGALEAFGRKKEDKII